MEIKYKPNSKEELKTLCDDLSVNLGEIDTSNVTDMSCLFFQAKRTDYSGIENWDVSNVKDMGCMFAGASAFNQDISKWNVSNVKYMEYMFYGAKSFNQDISNWNVSNVKYMEYMFYNSAFNKDISKWDVSNVKNMAWMFQDSPLEKIVKTTQWDWSKYHEQSNQDKLEDGKNLLKD